MDHHTMYAIANVSQLGLSMAVPIIICVLLGHFIDGKINTSPLFLIIFLIIGVAAAFRNLFYFAKLMIKK